MVQQEKGFSYYLAAFLRRKWMAAGVFVVIMAIGAGIAYSLPDFYRSQAVILIEQPEIPEELIRTTVTTYAAQQINTLNERIMTVGNMVDIIERFDLYAEERQETPVRLLASKVRQNAGIDFVSAETLSPSGSVRPIVIAFTVSFTDAVPAAAREVADYLVSLYMAENLRARTEQTVETTDFLNSQVQELNGSILELESGLAAFKLENADSLPSMNASNLQMMERVDSELMEISRRLSALDETRIGIQAQLATLDPSSPMVLPDGQVVVSPQDQLKALQTQLAVLQGRYSPTHPDVLKVQRDIKGLQDNFGLGVNIAEVEQSKVSAQAELARAKERYTAGHPDIVRLERQIASYEEQIALANNAQNLDSLEADNPAYIQLTTQLATLEAEKQSLLKQRALLNQRLLDYEQRLLRTPSVERELNALSRELSSTTNRYWVMRDKQFGAEMGQNLEAQSKGERFTLVEPPNLPLRPAGPNRPVILTLALLFAVVCGVGITQIADAMDQAIWGADSIEAVTGIQPVAEIPIIKPTKSKKTWFRFRSAARPAAWMAMTAVSGWLSAAAISGIWI